MCVLGVFHQKRRRLKNCQPIVLNPPSPARSSVAGSGVATGLGVGVGVGIGVGSGSGVGVGSGSGVGVGVGVGLVSFGLGPRPSTHQPSPGSTTDPLIPPPSAFPCGSVSETVNVVVPLESGSLLEILRRFAS